VTDLPSHLDSPRTRVTYLTAEQIPTIVRVARDVTFDGMAAIFDETFSALAPALGEHGITPAGPAFSLHHRQPGATMTFEVGFPVAQPLDGEIEADGIAFVPSSRPAGPIATISHLGGYDALSQAWQSLMQRVADDGYQPALPFWEVYVSEPGPDVDPSTLRTDLVTMVAGK